MTRPLAAYLCPPGYHAPRMWALAGEGTIVREATHLVFGRRRRRDAGAVDHAVPVLLIPGFMSGDSTLRRLAARLRETGHPTSGSGMHANVGCAQAAGDALEHRLERLVARTDRPAAVVGHSLGGLLAKALAHRRPDLVAGLITLGSPLLAPAAIHRLLQWDLTLFHHLHQWGFGALMSADCTRGTCAQTSWEQLTAPTRPGLPFTSVYSRSDGLVDWRACLHPAARHAEVRCSHLGMTIDSDVHTHVLHALQQIVTEPAVGAVGIDPDRHTA